MSAPSPRGASLAPGVRLGPYDVVARLGAGGMGEVYRARDTRLGRDVALKVIPFDVSRSPDRLRRFEQEARAVASLNHPSILAVYDVGTHAGTPYVVFELLEGESLRERLTREALPVRKAVDWAAQIARGLAAAHDRGIVHRDLKPENLFVTRDGRVKILDFGLAKLLLGEETVGDSGERSTLTGATDPGTLLGTMGYMSPEQLRGQAVDGRADIFALGAVLYEMLSGRRAFEGDTSVDRQTAILNGEPSELTSARGQTPPALAQIVKRCLEKSPEDRFQSARDLAFDLEAPWAQPGPVSPAAPEERSWRLGPLLVGAVLLAVAFLVGRQTRFASSEKARLPPQAEIRFRLTPPAPVRRVFQIRLSPDGRHAVFVGVGAEGRSQLWVHALSGVEARPLPGTEDVRGTPFWSPDSRSIGFFTLDRLEQIDVTGGPARMICDVPTAYDMLKSGSWSHDGVIIFAPGLGGMYRVTATGGSAVPVTSLDETRRERYHWFPQFHRDGHHFVYYVRSEDPRNAGVRLGSLDSTDTKLVLHGDETASYAWPGYLLFRRGGALLAQPLDEKDLSLTGEPHVVTDAVDAGGFSASETGILATTSSPPEMTQPTWFERSGRRLGTVGEPGPYQQIALSPDEQHAALQRLDPRLQTADIWLLDLTRGALSRVTSDPGTETDPVWSPDGRRLAFSARSESSPLLATFYKALGGKAERLLPEDTGWAYVEDWSPDGRFLLYGAGIGGRDGLWAVPVVGERKPFLLVPGGVPPVPNDEPQVSPDGRFLAYQSYEAGRFEVYVQAFPAPGARVRVSTEGGQQPRWSRGGRELIYLSADGTLMAVDVPAGPTLAPGLARKLFSTGLRLPTWDQYAVSADGQRFLFLAPVDAAPPQITIVLNWTAGLSR